MNGLEDRMKGVCLDCGDEFAWGRFMLGYKVCLSCGDKQAHKVKHCVVPMHKSNYVMLTNLQDLKGINNKGGFYK